MHDAFLVRRRERLGERARDLDELLHRESALGNAVIERLPLDQLHGEEVHAVGFLDGENRNDVRVIERGDGASFTLEAREALGIARHVGRQHLERHFAPELRVGSAIHLTHAARADRGGDAVVGERAANQIKPPGSRAIVSCRFLFLNENWADSAPQEAGMKSGIEKETDARYWRTIVPHVLISNGPRMQNNKDCLRRTQHAKPVVHE